jgi:hypothetical protein
MRSLRRGSVVLVLALATGCLDVRPRTEVHESYPDRPQPVTPVVQKDENPTSDAWPLDLWLVEFEKRNGLDIHYRDQDTVNHTVIRPGPGPFDTDEEALSILRQVCRRNGLWVIEQRPHVFELRRGRD